MQPHVLGHRRVLGDLERRRLRLVQHADRRRASTSTSPVASFGLTVSADRRCTVPDDADDVLGAQPLGRGQQRARRRARRTCETPARSRMSMKSTPPRSRTRCTQPSSTTVAADVARREARRRCVCDTSRLAVQPCSKVQGSRGSRLQWFRSVLRVDPDARRDPVRRRRPAARVPARRVCRSLTVTSPVARSSSPRIATTGTPRLDGVLQRLLELAAAPGRRRRAAARARSSAASASASPRDSSSRQRRPSRPRRRATTLAGNISRSVMTTMIRSSPSEKPQAGTSRPRNMPDQVVVAPAAAEAAGQVRHGDLHDGARVV